MAQLNQGPGVMKKRSLLDRVKKKLSLGGKECHQNSITGETVDVLKSGNQVSTEEESEIILAPETKPRLTRKKDFKSLRNR